MSLEILHKIVNEVHELDMLERTRQKCFINARFQFFLLAMYNDLATLDEIARYTDQTINNVWKGIRKAEQYAEFYDDFDKKLDTCQREYKKIIK